MWPACRGTATGGRAVTADQIDAPLQLALHDLEMRKYRLRRQALETELLRALRVAPAGERTAEILLARPVSPRMALEADRSRTRAVNDAPITVLAFCNFESPHCARLQVMLSQVLPLPFHRHAGMAAEAGRCAAEQGNYWRFHDMLYATTAAPDRARAYREGDAYRSV